MNEDIAQMGKKDDKRRELFREGLKDALEDPEMLKWLCKLIGGCTPSAEGDARVVDDLQRKVDALEKDNADLKKSLKDKDAELQKSKGDAEQNVKRLTEQNAELSAKVSKAQEEIHALKNKSLLPQELLLMVRHVKGDSELLSRFSLDAPLDDVDFLLRMTAALAPESQFKRLWEMYKERCVHHKAALSAEDERVLDMALGWVNASRGNQSCRLLRPSSGENYDYEKHQNPPSSKGDKVDQVWLPGVSGLNLKPLVSTRY